MNNAHKLILVQTQYNLNVFLVEISCKWQVYHKAWHTAVIVFTYGLASAVIPVHAQIPFGLWW